MKKPIVIIAGIILFILAILFWLAASVGPETAPQDVRSIDLPDTYGN